MSSLEKFERVKEEIGKIKRRIEDEREQYTVCNRDKKSA
jgi:hypothetical protein